MPEQTELAVEKFREYFSDTGIFENDLYPGIVKLLSQLKDSGVRLAITTSKATIYAKRIAEHFELDAYFDTIVGSELDGMRSSKSEVIVIGAKEKGLVGIGILWGYGSRVELLMSGATYVARLMLRNRRRICGI